MADELPISVVRADQHMWLACEVMSIRLSINGPFVPPAGSITDGELRLGSPPACTSQANSGRARIAARHRRDPMIQEIGSHHLTGGEGRCVETNALRQ